MHVSSYYWKDLSCELCKVLLPDTIIVNRKPIKLLDYHIPEGSSYVVLESYFGTDINSRIIHVLNFGAIKSLTVGRCRERESNIRILDNSVSRMHSLFTHSEGKYFLTDLSSKFGSQRIFRRPLKVKENVTVQVGKTIATFMLTYPDEECCWKSGGSSRNRINPFTYYEMVADIMPAELLYFFSIVEFSKFQKKFACENANSSRLINLSKLLPKQHNLLIMKHEISKLKRQIKIKKKRYESSRMDKDHDYKVSILPPEPSK